MRVGLLGKKLGHSYSPLIHSYLGNYTYELFEKKPDELELFLKSGDFHGLNVTIPYKKDVIPFLDELSDCASELGAVNTIVRRPDGTLIGHNTDYFGFRSMLKKSGLSVSGKKVLVLGSGGASATVVAALQKENANFVVISRSGKNNYQNIHLHADTAAIVNTTPVGMYPNAGVSPVDLNIFQHLEGVLDVVYNPARTQLLMDAEEKGLITENGLWMLVAQAKESAEWFTGNTICDERISEIHQSLCNQMENIVLIGMPGCGKSTIGRMLAERLNMKFVDADAQIEALIGMTIPQFFAENGESSFRTKEALVLAELGMESGRVIATGGGCVTQQRNYRSLHQNGRIYWIKRDVCYLPTEGRPLSQQSKLEDMFHLRKPMYESFADAEIDNNGSIEDAVERILQLEEVR